MRLKRAIWKEINEIIGKITLALTEIRTWLKVILKLIAGNDWWGFMRTTTNKKEQQMKKILQLYLNYWTLGDTWKLSLQGVHVPLLKKKESDGQNNGVTWEIIYHTTKYPGQNEQIE